MKHTPTPWHTPPDPWDGKVFPPVVIQPQTTEQLAADLHHRHDVRAACAACEIVALRKLRSDLFAALRPVANAYPDDPGTSDLDNEQPVTITLGDVRRAWRALGKAGAR